jgi:GT2 family glycosyltransferase
MKAEPHQAHHTRQEYSPTTAPLVAAVVVNWQRPDLTIECLESLRASDYPNVVVIVCDNGSLDGSVEKMCSWARTQFGAPSQLQLGRFASNAQVKRTWVNIDDLQQFDAGVEVQELPWLSILQSKQNTGFAGGVNAGIRFSLSQPKVEFVWVLNNDTIVAPTCLSEMVLRFQETPAASMCGSRILFYDHPNIVQALGGATFCRLTGESRIIGAGLRNLDVVDVACVEKKLDHLFGASMLVSRRFLEDVGLLEESYFLFYEEIDWVSRARGRCKMVYADRAIVYHRGGATTGTSSFIGTTSPESAFFGTKSRIKFLRRFRPWALPTAVAFCVARAGYALCLGHRAQAAAIFAALLGNDLEEK